MKRLLAPLLVLMGLTSATAQSPKVQMVDPKTIRFSMPTISADIPEVVALKVPPAKTDLVFHEDEWSQVEFYPMSQLADIKRALAEYKPFEQAHRVKHGWTEIYTRRIRRVPVVGGRDALARLAGLLTASAQPGPVLAAGSSITGRVKDGFTLPLGSGVSLYGVVNASGLPVLAADLQRGADDLKLTQTFVKLSQAEHLVLVDWRSQLILVGTYPNGDVQSWRP
jgi:hypothetical protein